MTMRAWALAVALLPALAHAWPVETFVDVEAGGEKFQRLGAVDWLEVEDPSVATVEWLPSGELLVSGKKAGRTLVLLGAQGKSAVWGIRVSAKGQKPKAVSSEAALSAASRACPGLETHPGSEDEALVATIPDERCRLALLALLETDAFRAKELDLTFTLPALQSQLSAFQKALPSGLEASYLGAGLVLKGSATERDHRHALWVLFRHSVGRVALDDEVQITDAPDAGGSAEP
jgi:hypothetical protein